ncbi:hypothetical protein TcBrA4_0027970 [Trypanosoma cruzi]|nr:hypothetical protein TcBrA4_0027970 [Trypanosoma cruzi]
MCCPAHMTQLSPKDEYTRACTKLGCHVNSHLMRELPDTLEALIAVKKLDFSRSMLGRSDVEPLVQAILFHCSGLQVLNLSQNYLTDDSIVQICEALLAHTLLLVSLDLSNNPISNKTGRYLLRFMESMPALRFVGVQKTLMNDSMMRLFPHSSKALCPPVVEHRASTLSTAVTVATSNISSIMKTSPSSSLREATKDDNPHPSQKTQWPALETLWRAAAVAAPTHNNYSSLGTLISSMRIRIQEVSEVQQLPVSSGDSKKQTQQSY